MIKKLYVFAVCLAVGFFLITVGSSVSYACKCDGQPSVGDEFEKSAAVFTGKVIDIKEEKESGTDSRTKKVLFEVSGTWKGLTESQVLLGYYQTSCSIDFKKGKEYLVYAKENPDFKNKAVLTSEVCNRTVEVGKAGEDLAFLGQGDSPVKQVNLQEEMERSAASSSLLLWSPVLGVAALVGLFIWKGAKN
ncbi:hypothetical protein DRW41_08945 [Neobacillus piezotolerans]|uniref:Cobalamin biosynthesis protein CbiN n=1 Tax=Neobacillus piezotolerans TaxID=2259171 RepID=A0A3D8GV65_9BACI|nr:hypothetical protein [Neobacillus piezotolerans]RDU37926.1 hypothetical protein DRW41_08945 [Neobacillus piezotolerans]